VSRHAIVLAAGAGRRFGGRKLLAPWRGAPLLQGAVRAALGTRTERVTVVLGADAREVRGAMVGLDDPRLATVTAADWRAGLSASLRAGVRALPDDASACVVFLGDMPEASAALADALLDRVEAGAPAARPAHAAGPAHPIAFGRGVFTGLMVLTGDRGARDLLCALGEAVAHIPVSDDGAVFDIDHPGDLERWGGPK
jgi:molybdenum cofactor cytidylyltransferase